jgi:hypothetical protein
MESRLEDSDSVILRREFASAAVFREHASSSYQPQRTFNICNSVVFPALSRPRNRSFACLFISPRAERVSQTVVRSISAVAQERSCLGEFASGRATTYTS